MGHSESIIYHDFAHTFPQALGDRYSNDCLARRELQHQLYADILGSKEPNLLIPFHSEKLDQLFDFIGCVLIFESNNQKKALAIVENPLNSRPGGVGKTSLAMKLVGASIQPNSLPDIINNSTIDPQNFQPAFLELENTHSLQIASLDLAFAGLIENQLSVAPILGLKADTQWDIARNLTRIKALEQNMDYDRTIPYIRQYQTELAKKIVIPDKLFLPKDTTIPITKLLVVNYWESSVDVLTTIKPQINLIVNQEKQNISQQIFKSNPIYHPSSFWQIDEFKHQLTIEKIANYLPQDVASLNIYPNALHLSSDAFSNLYQDAAKLIVTWIIN